MHTRSFYLAAISISLALVGCGEKRIDTSSEERMKESIKKVRASVPESDREKFDESLTAVTTSSLKPTDIFSGNKAILMAKVEQSLEGKTAKEIIAEGQAIIEKQRAEEAEERAKEEAQRAQEKREAEARRAELQRMAEARRVKEQEEAEARRLKEKQEAEARRAREMQQAREEIATLTEKKQRAEESKSELGKFKVTRSRFYMRKSELGLSEPIIELALTNNTGVSVSRAFFAGTLASPGREIPWLKETFNYEIPGGMAPGESKQLKLSPNMFSKWSQVESPADAVFTVEVTRVNGPDGKTAFDSEAFSNRDAERLAELEMKFPSSE